MHKLNNYLALGDTLRYGSGNVKGDTKKNNLKDNRG
jgi:hypothetical protein